jgi:hypothetical protein
MTNAEFNEIFRERTKNFAVRTSGFWRMFLIMPAQKFLSYQLGKSATSVGANFRGILQRKIEK